MGTRTRAVVAMAAAVGMVACAGLIGLDEPVGAVDAGLDDATIPDTGDRSIAESGSDAIDGRASDAGIFDPTFHGGRALPLPRPTIAIAKFGADGAIAYLEGTSARVLDATGEDVTATAGITGVNASTFGPPFASIDVANFAWFERGADSYLAIGGTGIYPTGVPGIWTAPLQNADNHLPWGVSMKFAPTMQAMADRVDSVNGPTLIHFDGDGSAPANIVFQDSKVSVSAQAFSDAFISTSSLAVTSDHLFYGALFGEKRALTVGLHIVNSSNYTVNAGVSYPSGFYTAATGSGLDSVAVASLPNDPAFLVVEAEGNGLHAVTVPVVLPSGQANPTLRLVAMASGLHLTSVAVLPSGDAFYAAGCQTTTSEDGGVTTTPWIVRLILPSFAPDPNFGGAGVLPGYGANACVDSLVVDGAGNPNALVNEHDKTGVTASYIVRFRP